MSIPYFFDRTGRSKFPFSIKFCLLHFAIGLAGFTACSAATYTAPRRLNVGDVYELRRDGWTNQLPSGYEGDVQPKLDENLGTTGDNPYYRRHNVSRAWATGTGYWFTDTNQFAGEPDPAAEQWVDYVPPFEILGPGRYSIEIGYRWAASRASYPAVYTVHHVHGTNVTLQSQRVGVAGSSIVYVALGPFEMAPGSFVRVEDTGSEIITFGNGRFRLVEPFPQLQISVSDGFCDLRWRTNSFGLVLEYSMDIGDSAWWLPASEISSLDGNQNLVRIPIFDERRYFRLAKPDETPLGSPE